MTYVINSTDHKYFDAIANDPAVRSRIVPPGTPDEFKFETEKLFKQGYLGFKTRHGGFILCPHPMAPYSVHALFPPQPDRGKKALEDGREFLRYALGGGHVEVLDAQAPCNDTGTNALLESTGFVEKPAKFHDGMWWRVWQITKEHWTSLK